jgi:hypothetical protein
MARKTRIILTDDFDGSEATTTVDFGLDGISYEIDLNEENAQKLREDISTWTGRGRRVRGRARRGTAQTGSSDTKRIRQWALDNGYQVSDRGRVPGEIRAAYASAHGDS